MLTRQKALLRFIANAGDHIGKTRLQKLSFVLRSEIKDSPTSLVYQFVPYQFGPYSFTLNHELRSLESEGYVRLHEQDIQIQPSIKIPDLDRGLTYAVDMVSRRFASVKTETLVSLVYKQDPWYTAKARDKSKRLSTIPKTSCHVFTIGYEGLMLEGLLDLLLRNGIERLIDVRANPVARRFGFHRSTLLRHCQDLNIEYVHIPELGIDSESRSDLNSPKAYETLFYRYETETLAINQEAVALATKLILEKPSALMCMEADCLYCHRSYLAREISRKTELGIRELRIR
jgi:uncharacterized protein (DUF488 family)